MLTPITPTHLTDVNDVSYVKATIADAAGHVVTSSSAAVTFADHGAGHDRRRRQRQQLQETFRGNVRNAYQGVAFAIVQATGAGTITVTRSALGPDWRLGDHPGDRGDVRAVLGQLRLTNAKRVRH